MRGKYTTLGSYYAAHCKRGLLRASLRGLLQWGPIDEPEAGYTIIIACHGPLAPMVLPSFELLSRQDLTHLRQIILSFDRPEHPSLRSLSSQIAEKHPHLNLRVLYQSSREAWLLRKIGWGWVDCWLSYAKGIALSSTRNAILHDMDCMLLRPDFFEQRYRLILETGDHFLGTEWYEGNGVTPEDQLAYIVEMAFDAAYIRSTCRPLDLFNVIGRLGERSVDFDTLLYPQTRTSRRSMVPVNEDDMVHPSQVVSQYTLLSRKSYRPLPRNNALFIPYFYYLAGDEDPLGEATRALQNAASQIDVLGRTLDVSRQTIAHAAWLFKQATRIENAVAGAVRAKPADYFRSICDVAARNAAKI
jgi:hypothetical protein